MPNGVRLIDRLPIDRQSDRPDSLNMFGNRFADRSIVFGTGIRLSVIGDEHLYSVLHWFYWFEPVGIRRDKTRIDSFQVIDQNEPQRGPMLFSSNPVISADDGLIGPVQSVDVERQQSVTMQSAKQLRTSRLCCKCG